MVVGVMLLLMMMCGSGVMLLLMMMCGSGGDVAAHDDVW